MELASPDATEKTKKRKKPLEQSVPHRVIEKRRRDRINKSLEQIRAMLPVSRTQRVRNDKVDVLTATIDYLQELQQAVGSATTSNGGYDNKTSSSSSSSDEQLSPPVTELSSPPETTTTTTTTTTTDDYRWYGFRHCIAEAKRFLVDEEKFDVAADGIVARLVEHLEKRAPPPPPNGRRNDAKLAVSAPASFVLPAAVLKTSDGGGAVSMPTPENVQNLNGLELISRIAQDQLRSESPRASGGDIAAILPQGDGGKKEEGVVDVPTASQAAAYYYWPPSYVAAAAAANNWK
ncbi:hairy/enhancer-of-split related with YRPW motif protein 2-like [Oscarella lobularis]|uniref:hairy/enhancer-of-split related with YRPW motif protein 2-like n=1 Tax=Oscarella lobularis TaxID=121494 RepID=UPI0033135C04